MYKAIMPIAAVNGYAVPPGWYSAFEVADDADDKRSLHEAWTTPEQRAYNASRRTCPDCRGRGYLQERDRRGRVYRENCGCQTCLGLGSVPKAAGDNL